MPICTGKDKQGEYTVWSHKTGKRYYHSDEGGAEGALDKAKKQAAAAHAAGYESDRDRCMSKGEKQVKAEEQWFAPAPQQGRALAESASPSERFVPYTNTVAAPLPMGSAPPAVLNELTPRMIYAPYIPSFMGPVAGAAVTAPPSRQTPVNDPNAPLLDVFVGFKG